MSPSSDPGGVIRPWQAILLWLALACLTACVLAPALTVLWVGASLVVAAVAVAPFSELVGTSPFLLGGAVHLAVATLVIPACIAGMQTLRRQRAASTSGQTPPPPWWRGTWAWLAGALVCVDLVFVPAHPRFGLHPLRAAIAGGLLASVAFAICALLRGAWGLGSVTVNGLWKLGRRSGMVTGVLVATAVLVPAFEYASFAVLDAIGRASLIAVGDEASRVCDRPGMGVICASRRPPPSVLSTSGLPVDDTHRAMALCMEALHGRSADGRDLYAEMVEEVARRLRNRDDALDVVQQTLLAVCEAHERSPITDLPPYFYRSVINRAENALRQRRCAVPPDEELQLPCTALSPEEQAIRDERIRLVDRAFCNLQLHEAMVIELRDLQGLDYGEVARRLGCSDSTARQRHSRALDALTQGVRRLCR